jgi:arylsulfatase A-like enzyme
MHRSFALLLLFCWTTVAIAADRPPNVLLIVADDLGYGDLGCYGGKHARTPTIDALAGQGMRFTQFRVNPLCAPTRAALLSGQYSLECGVWRAPNQAEPGDEHRRELHHDVILLPQFLKQAGYATGMFGKWHLGYDSPNRPNDRGFDQFVGFLGGAHPYQGRNNSRILRNGQPLVDRRHLTDLFTDEAISFIEANQSRPWFCYLPYNAVHGPLWEAEHKRPSGKPEWLAKGEGRGLDFPLRDYCAVLEHLDDSIGRVLKTVHEQGLDEQTLVLFISDNGALEEKYPGDNGPLRGEKGTVYEGGIRVPGMIRWTNQIPAGTISDAPAMVFDLFATCLEAARVAIPKTNGKHPVHGVSLLEHARSKGASKLPQRHLFWDLWGKLAVWHDGWKLVGMIDNHRGRFAEAVPQIEAAQFELYYLPDDLAEQHDLAASKPAQYAELKERLLAWFKASTQPWPAWSLTGASATRRCPTPGKPLRPFRHPLGRAPGWRRPAAPDRPAG